MISISLPQSDQAYSGHLVNTHNVVIYEAFDMRLYFNLSLQLTENVSFKVVTLLIIEWALINEGFMPRILVHTNCRYV